MVNALDIDECVFANSDFGKRDVFDLDVIKLTVRTHGALEVIEKYRNSIFLYDSNFTPGTVQDVFEYWSVLNVLLDVVADHARLRDVIIMLGVPEVYNDYNRRPDPDLSFAATYNNWLVEQYASTSSESDSHFTLPLEVFVHGGELKLVRCLALYGSYLRARGDHVDEFSFREAFQTCKVFYTERWTLYPEYPLVHGAGRNPRRIDYVLRDAENVSVKMAIEVKYNQSAQASVRKDVAKIASFAFEDRIKNAEKYFVHIGESFTLWDSNVADAQNPLSSGLGYLLPGAHTRPRLKDDLPETVTFTVTRANIAAHVGKWAETKLPNSSVEVTVRKMADSNMSNMEGDRHTPLRAVLWHLACRSLAP
jgi:hypothetical protein